MTETIYPCLWFDGNAKEAAEFYCSVFKNSKITTDTPMVVLFDLNGKKFMGLNGGLPAAPSKLGLQRQAGPDFKFNESVSFVVDCENQEEIDYYWYKLTEGGSESMCGWLKDKFGLSWQIVPKVLGKLMTDPERSHRVVQAFMKMKKFNIAELENA